MAEFNKTWMIINFINNPILCESKVIAWLINNHLAISQ